MRIGFNCYNAENVPSYRRKPGSPRGCRESSSRGSAGSRPSVARTCSAGDFSLRSHEKHNVCDAGLDPVSAKRSGDGWIPAFAGMTGKICGMMLAVLMVFVIGNAYATDSTDRKTVTSKKYVDDQIATKQPILNASGTDLRNNVVMYTNQAGEVTSKPISTTLSGTGIDNNLPTVGAVNTGLAAKQNEIGAGTASGNVVTYTGSPGTVGEKPVYNSNATYNSNALIEANHANSAIRKGLNDHLSCVDGNRGPNNECWLWTIEDQAINTVYTPHNN